MKWFLLALVIFAGAALVYRIYSSQKKAREEHDSGWDAKLVSELRRRGMDPFQPHDVDFFFALPSEAACAAVNRRLEGEGFRVDVKAVPEDKEFPYSLHAVKSMRLQAPEMKELSRRFAELARANQGRYDGWGST